jgi:acyl-CoA dehydrogenase
MNFEQSVGSAALQRDLLDFMRRWVIPAEERYWAEFDASSLPQRIPPVMEELKSEARSRGLWNLFLPDPEYGAGLSNVDYAPLAEITGHSPLAPEALNCSAPDTGNMELLALFGSQEQKERWLNPLLRGEIRSCIVMTEPEVASSDPSNIACRIQADGDHYIINGRKWWISGAAHPQCRIGVLMGATDPKADRHYRHTFLLVPMDTRGVTLLRQQPVFGYEGPGGHCEVRFEDVRVPNSNRIGEEGDAFGMAQARLGPGRIHHAMRAIGMAERALHLLCMRARARTAFGKLLAEQGVVQEQIARSRLDIDQARLLCLHAAWLMDSAGNKAARTAIAEIKVAAPNVACTVIDRAIQVHGAAGLSADFPLAQMYAWARALKIVDGPDEVHLRTIARAELAAESRKVRED